MQIVYQTHSQGNALKLYHGGYLAVELTGAGFGFQLYTEQDYDNLIQALIELKSRNFPHESES
jgi:hypothetical protein